MRLRAVIFDVYGTLLRVGPAPSTATADWERLFEDTFGCPPHLSLSDLSDACRKVVAREHEIARNSGIRYPEIVWPSIMAEVLPGLASLVEADREDFVFRHVQLLRTISLDPDAVVLLQQMPAAGLQLGIASNAQAYTLREMGEAFSAVGLDWTALFDPRLRFWSFEHGFSKPDPHVFRILTARLAAQGCQPDQVLMVGDRVDNDIEPARACGWKTWLLNPDAPAGTGGTWRSLADASVAGNSLEPREAVPRPRGAWS